MNFKNLNFKNYLWVIPFLSFLLGYFTIQKIFQPKSFNTPAIVGKKLQEAIAILSKNQLYIKFVAEKEDSSLPHGTILSQKPVPGLQITPNQTVYVTISKKHDKSLCPDLMNKNISDINQTLKDKNLRNRCYYLPSNLPGNSCIAQYPAPESSIKDKSVITYISKGSKKPVIFPNFKNKNLSEVLEFLENHNIKTEILYTNKAGAAKYQQTQQAQQEQVEQNSSSSSCVQETQKLQDQLACQTSVAPEQQNTQAQTTENTQIQATQTTPATNQAVATQDSQNNQAQAQVAQETQNISNPETENLTILDQRPLAGSLINLDSGKPITVHLKVFKK